MSGTTLSGFADKVLEIMPTIAREFLKQHAGSFHKMKITVPQLFVMDVLNREEELKMTDLARSMHVTTAAMTGLVERLVRDGYVAREHDLKDRRIVKINLTAKGKKVINTVVEEKRKATMKIFGMISQKEREDYIKILTHIQHHLEERTGNR